MSHKADALGKSLIRDSGDCGEMWVPKALLERCGIPAPSEAYCDWLDKYGLRQFHQRTDEVLIGKRRS